MRNCFADFHVHIGRAQGKPVKMAAAPSLTLESLIAHARDKKGLDIVTVIDGVCTGVLNELKQLVAEGRLEPLSDGGIKCENGLVILLGAEVEVAGPDGGAAHFGCWLPTLAAAEDFNHWLSTIQKNVSLSSQRARVDAVTLQREVKAREGIFVVHHAFTPHKGLYGNCVSHLADMVDTGMIDALELGLSADTDMADTLSELSDITFLSNSDAHSLPKIAREYNQLDIMVPSFTEVQRALLRQGGRRVTANYGLRPALGKYYLSYCLGCERPWPNGAEVCPCGSTKSVRGVRNRLEAIQDLKAPHHPSHRPPYVHQVPLQFIPGLGPKTMERLFEKFGTEMAILHQATVEEIQDVVGEKLGRLIDDARSGRGTISAGAGGIYGRYQSSEVLT